MRILLVTDAFPPRCGGSGWSTFHLARALVDAGHHVKVVKPEPNLAGTERRSHDGVGLLAVGFPEPPVPYLRNRAREEPLRRRLSEALIVEAGGAVDVVHAQHLLGAAAAVSAARTLGVPAVVTVRDYWPVCYFTTWHVSGEQCPDCSFAKMLACMRGKSPRLYWAGLPMMPYMRASVGRRQDSLREAAAVVAVSGWIADRVVRPIVGAKRTRVIPNLIDVDEVERATASAPSIEVPERSVLFAGKLDTHKGAGLLVEIAERLRDRMTLVVAGDGPERPQMEERARAAGLDVRFPGWVDNAEIWRLMRQAAIVLVPSLWDEPLSRTVIEAMAAGATVVATDGGGVHDQIESGRSGVLVPKDPEAIAHAIDELLHDGDRRRALGDTARDEARRRFHPSAVRPRFEALYRELIGGSAAP